MTLILAWGGTTWAEPCDAVTPDQKSCLLEERARLHDELAQVKARLYRLDKLIDIVRKRTINVTDDFWLTLDVGTDIVEGVYPSIGVSFPVGPIYLSPGVWLGSDYDSLRSNPAWGLYLSFGYSWTLVD